MSGANQIKFGVKREFFGRCAVGKRLRFNNGDAMRTLQARITLTLSTLLLVTGCAHNNAQQYQLPVQSPAYDYPIDNPYAATIIGTPTAQQQQYTHIVEPKERVLTVFPDRKIPEGFWYYDGLIYGEMLQDHPASLIYIIGGTGSGYKSRYMMAMARTLYAAGHHVVMLPSPTHSNFIVTASSNFLPGNASADAADIYRVINLIQPRVAKRADVTSVGLTGFSLGAWNAAFVARLDAQEKRVGFNKVLLVNSPLNLYSSLHRLDAMLLQGLPGGVNGLDVFLDKAMARLSKMSKDSDAFDFTNANLLYESYLKTRPSDERMATTIGLAFRLSAANMIFTSDVMSHSGYIFPKDRPFLSSTPLNDYLAVALRTGLSDYYRDIYDHYYMSRTPGLTQQQLIGQSGLESLRDWLADNNHVGLITNRDDVTLAPGELERLEALFPGRAWIFPTGGHLGNIEHRAVAWRIARFFAEGQQP